jgi:hypothetical protein
MYSTVKELYQRDNSIKSGLIALNKEKETLNKIIKQLELERTLIKQMLEFHKAYKNE